MSTPAPRIEIDLGKIRHNASSLVGRLGGIGISVTGITKACLGSSALARVMQQAGIHSIGDSRITNIANMRQQQVETNYVLTRSPMLSEVDAVVAHADISFHSELCVISQLSRAAQAANRQHGIVLMVEMGDLREGLMPDDLVAVARAVVDLPNVYLHGIGCNLACYGGVVPDTINMTALSDIADALENALSLKLEIVSGGNSANLNWAFSNIQHGRINNLRLGESILLGRETLDRQAIAGLHTDAFRLLAEVIESKVKPCQPYGKMAQTAFGIAPNRSKTGRAQRSILAIGRQDCAPEGLTPPNGIKILGASSDHLIVESHGVDLAVGSEVAFQPNYSALLCAMSSSYVSKVFL